MADVAAALTEALSTERLRIVAGLIRVTRDWELAEDSVQDAAERALARWPNDGIPSNPAAWLTTTARRRALDVLHRRRVEVEKLRELEALAGSGSNPTEPEDARPLRRRSCAAPVCVLPPGVATGGPGGSDPQDRRRTVDPRDRPRLPGQRGNHEPASAAHAGQDRARRDRLSDPRAPPASRSGQRRPGRYLSDLQRRLRGDRGRLPARRADFGGDSPGRPARPIAAR